MITGEYSVPSSWYDGVYQDKAAPCNAGRSFSLKHTEKSDNAVLCIHGYTGYPGELVRPAEDLFNAGCDVFVPRLPGHGTSGRDFGKTRIEDWIRVAENAASDLVRRYRNVYLVGHSMGGAIALVTASEVEGIRRAVAAAPAVYAGEKLPAHPSAAKALSFFVKRIKHEWQPNPEYNMHYEGAPADDIHLGKEYWSWIYLRQIIELNRIMRRAADCIPQIKIPVKILVCGKDTILPNPEYPEFIKANASVPFSFHKIENATHYVYYDKDPAAEEEAVQETLSFIV